MFVRYHSLVYTRPLSITNPAFGLATQPLSIRDGERSRVHIKYTVYTKTIRRLGLVV